MALDTVESRTIVEGNIAEYDTILQDSQDPPNPIPAGAIDVATLTLYDVDTRNDVGGGIINGRELQDVLNANNVTIDALGNLHWDLESADNPAVGTREQGELEAHVALFEITYNTDKQLNHAVYIYVEALDKVP